MPRPFPFPFNIGTDICSISRIYEILKGINGRRFVRRVLIERERHEGLERLDGPLERWKLAGRTSSVLEWKMRELGLTAKELNKRRYKLKGKLKKELSAGKGGEGDAEGDAELGKEEGKTIRRQIRVELRRELAREIKAEEEAEKRLKLKDGVVMGEEGEKIEVERELAKEEGGEGKMGGDSLVVKEEHNKIEGEKGEVVESEAIKRIRKELIQSVMDKKEGLEKGKEVVATGKEGEEVEKDEKTMVQKRLERLDVMDIMLRLLDENDRDMGAAAKGLFRAAEFLAGRFAAKEAAIKAHHNRKLTYHSIAIHRPPGTEPSEGSQPPVAIILPESGKWEEGQEARISISHDGDYATAVCLAFDPRSKRKDKMEKSGSWQPTGAVLESTRHILTQLEMDDMDPEEEEDDYTWKETEDALRAKNDELTAINDPQLLIRVENLSPDVTAEDLLELFRGKSEKVRAIVPLAADGKKLPYGFVSLAKRQEAVRARGETDRTVLKGNKITTRWMGGKKAKSRGLGKGGKRIFTADELKNWVESVKPDTETSAAVAERQRRSSDLLLSCRYRDLASAS